MGTTSEFLKLRSKGTPQLGEWNYNYSKALDLAKQNGKFIITCWSNGDACGYCVATEKCMMDKVFTNWMKTSDAYFVFQYSGDPNKGKTVHDWVYKGTGLKYFPGFRITIYDANGKIGYDQAVEGNTLRNNKSGTTGAKEMVANLNKILANKPADGSSSSDTPSAPENYKVRFNEKLTVKKVNSILDAIDKNGGYCPCQAQKSADTKCQCKDFRDDKKIGEPCICNLYVKMKK